MLFCGFSFVKLKMGVVDRMTSPDDFTCEYDFTHTPVIHAMARKKRWFAKIIDELKAELVGVNVDESVEGFFWKMAELSEEEWKNHHRRGSLQRGVAWFRKARKRCQTRPLAWKTQLARKIEKRDYHMHQEILDLFAVYAPCFYDNAKSKTCLSVLSAFSGGFGVDDATVVVAGVFALPIVKEGNASARTSTSSSARSLVTS